MLVLNLFSQPCTVDYHVMIAKCSSDYGRLWFSSSQDGFGEDSEYLLRSARDPHHAAVQRHYRLPTGHQLQVSLYKAVQVNSDCKLNFSFGLSKVAASRFIH